MPEPMNRSEHRQALHDQLVEILGSNHVYYDPPESFKMVYPCIVYTRQGMYNVKADNKSYISKTEYEVTYISRTPDDSVIDALMRISGSYRYNRHFVSDKLHHDVFYVYVH